MIRIDNIKIDKSLLYDEIEYLIDVIDNNSDVKIVNLKKSKIPVYRVEDFLKYHDTDFLKNVYKKVLLRDIDNSELNNRLNLLRSGKVSKGELLARIRFSKEGRDKNIKIIGIEKRLIMAILNRIPIINFFVKLFMLPRLFSRLNRFEYQYFIDKKDFYIKIDSIQKELDINVENFNREIKDISKNLYSIREEIYSKIKSDTNSLNTQIDNLKFRVKELNRAREQILNIRNRISTFLDRINSDSIYVDDKVNILNNMIKENDRFLDDFYMSFEDRFRGSREDIKERQSYYLPIVESVIKVKEHELIIDIGSGRGEWLELLKNSGFRAKGADLNRLMVQESKALNLDVIEQDGIEFLKSLDENSVSVITGFHIVEHLPFKVLIELFDESYRVLRDGGLIIFETPNPENILVGSCSFYTDPTHKNPIPPVTLEFLAQNRGFRDVKVHRLHPIKEPIFVDIPNSGDLNNLISASTNAQDYSIVGYK